MDELDRARHYQDKMNEAALSQRKPEPGLAYMGECHNCGEAVEEPKRFCDSDCSREWEELQARRAGR